MLPGVRAAAVGLSVALWAQAACAQVNAEALRAQLTKDAKMASLDFSLVSRVGNTVGTIFNGSVQGALVLDKHLMFARAQADYSSANGKSTVSRAFVHGRYNYTLQRAVRWEVYSQLQSDKFRRLARRAIIGTGPRWEFIDTDAFELFAGASYMLESELLTATESAQKSSEFNHRLSAYVGVNAVFDPNVQLSVVTYLQPRFDHPADYRALYESQLVLGVSKMLALKLGVVLRYDNEPPADVRRLDLEVKNSLTLRF